MNIISYNDSDELRADLRHRSDLAKYIPHGGTMLTEAASWFWAGVLQCFRDGRRADGITEIERRFEPRRTKGTDAAAMVAARVAGRKRRMAA